MCEVSDELKLCSCGTTDYYTFKHYWSFHRFIAGKEDFLVGEAMLPALIAKEMHTLNYKTLIKLLNKGNPFDVKLDFQKNDRLCLSFTSDEFENRIFYGFCFNGLKWMRYEVDFIEWQWHHEEQSGGIIRNAIRNDRD